MKTENAIPDPWPALAGVLLFLLASFLVGGDPVDDAGITFRYARNLAGGEGLCFNPGLRVEGYVHFLWIVLLAAVEIVTGVSPMEAGPLLGRMFGALSVVWTALVSAPLRRPGKSGRAYLDLAPLLLGTNLYFLLWSQAGLETPLFTWLLLVSLHLLLKGGRTARLGTPLVLVFLCMTRPEGILVAAAMAMDALLERPRLDLRVATVLLVFLIPAGLYFIWRWTYFGHFLPNVFYAKADLGWRTGLYYLYAFLRRLEPRILLPSGVILMVLACTVIPVLVAGSRLLVPPLRLLTLVVLLWLIGVAYEGGDWMGAFRFLVPCLPLLVLTGAAVAAHLAHGGRLKKILALLLVGTPLAFNLLNGTLYACLPPEHPCRTWFHQRRYYDDMASWVKEHVEPGSLLALGDMGYIPYETLNMRYIDFLGLVDPTVAHLEGGIQNPNLFLYIYNKKPAYFLSIVHHPPGGNPYGHTPVDEAMFGFLDQDLPKHQRLFVKVKEIEGWVQDGERISFYVYERRR